MALIPDWLESERADAKTEAWLVVVMEISVVLVPTAAPIEGVLVVSASEEVVTGAATAGAVVGIVGVAASVMVAESPGSGVTIEVSIIFPVESTITCWIRDTVVTC